MVLEETIKVAAIASSFEGLTFNFAPQPDAREPIVRRKARGCARG